ncbi:hypothetical protein WNY78_13000 [Psychroserpens sp. AS72]|uniref:hypothetical protein n=1 Tax=Psychroserpens sp. AS72 TaxID=3135775 RepID=UPI0031777EBD
MKAIITLVFVLLTILSSYGQDLKLSILKGTDKPNSEKEHLYLLGVTNTGNIKMSFSISAINKQCVDEKSSQIDLSHQIMNKYKATQADQLNLKPGESIEVYVKISRPLNAKLNSWNCTEIKAISSNGNAVSNAIIIESLIPDPKDFN